MNNALMHPQRVQSTPKRSLALRTCGPLLLLSLCACGGGGGNVDTAPPPSVITGTVVDDATGLPIANATVTLALSDGQVTSPTPPNGLFSLNAASGLFTPSGAHPVVVVATATNHEPGNLTLADKQAYGAAGNVIRLQAVNSTATRFTPAGGATLTHLGDASTTEASAGTPLQSAWIGSASKTIEMGVLPTALASLTQLRLTFQYRGLDTCKGSLSLLQAGQTVVSQDIALSNAGGTLTPYSNLLFVSLMPGTPFSVRFDANACGTPDHDNYEFFNVVGEVINAPAAP